MSEQKYIVTAEEVDGMSNYYLCDQCDNREFDLTSSTCCCAALDGDAPKVVVHDGVERPRRLCYYFEQSEGEHAK